MTEVFSGATLEEAKQKASRAFGVPVDSIEFTVLEEPKRGFFSGLFGKKDAEYQVKAVVNVSDPEPSPVEEKIPEASPFEADSPEPEEQEEKKQAEEPVSAEEPAPSSKSSLEENGPRYDEVPMEIQQQKMEAAIAYVNGILEQFGDGVQCEGKISNGIYLTLTGEHAGSMIGRRGETLDALQHLASMAVNRSDSDYVRILIDACSYREKRRKTLQELTQRISRSVIRNGRSVALEPMNPYERRIIHSEVSKIEGVSSHSIGEEPYRKVMITPDGPSASRPAREEYHQGGRPAGRGDRGRRRNDRRPAGEPPRKLDLSTSFEKDYKRPKPEDSLNAGVYGKIDL